LVGDHLDLLRDVVEFEWILALDGNEPGRFSPA
jgi:hypothetical protein